MRAHLSQKHKGTPSPPPTVFLCFCDHTDLAENYRGLCDPAPDMRDFPGKYPLRLLPSVPLSTAEIHAAVRTESTARAPRDPADRP
jgi:hypothetical protein